MLWNPSLNSDNINDMKIMKRDIPLVWLITLLFIAVFASRQGATAQSKVLPYPSHLRASAKENLVILSWTDSPDTKGKYIVYRSDKIINAGNLSSSTRLGDISSGSQTYTDTPPDSTPYFYAVFALADDGMPYLVYVPMNTTTTIGISVGLASPIVPSPTASPSLKTTSGTIYAQTATSAAPSAFVSAIKAKTKGDAIVISYEASPKSQLVLYRGTKPLVGAADLLNASLIAAFTDKDGRFADYPVPGVDYYYAILGEEDLKAGRISIIPGVNSLTFPTQVRAAAISSGFSETPPESRTTPLPYFLMEDGVSGNTVLSQNGGPTTSRPVSSETEKAIAALLLKSPPVNTAMPATRILPEELSIPSGGEDYSLSLIVSERIVAKDWLAAIDQLRKYLSLNRSPKASARARFYLGEALAYSGSSRDSFFEFLSARDFYPIETKPWIEYVLSILQKG